MRESLPLVRIISPALSLLLLKGGLRYCMFTKKELRILERLQERVSLLPFFFLYITSASYIFSTIITFFFSGLFFIWGRRLRVWCGCGRNLHFALSTLLLTALITFFTIVWEKKVVELVEEIQETDPEWFEIRTQLFIYGKFSPTWWISFVRVYGELMTMSVYTSAMGLSLLLLMEVVFPALAQVCLWFRRSEKVGVIPTLNFEKEKKKFDEAILQVERRRKKRMNKYRKERK